MKVIPGGRTSPQEARILSALAAQPRPNVLQLQACFSYKNELYLVTELMCGSDLDTVLVNAWDNGDAYFDQLRAYASCLVQAIVFLHSHYIGHFDLKGTNIMVSRGGTLKLLDFGMAEVVMRPLTAPKQSTAHYLAPEVMRVNRSIDPQSGYGLAADVWSLGICLYYWYTWCFPFGHDENLPSDIYMSLIDDDPSSLRPPFRLKKIQKAPKNSITHDHYEAKACNAWPCGVWLVPGHPADLCQAAHLQGPSKNHCNPFRAASSSKHLGGFSCAASG